MEKTVWESAFDAPQQSQVEEVKQEEIVNDGMSDDLSILVNFGRLTTTFNFWGHSFVIQSLKMNEELQVNQLASEYANRIDQGAKAFAAATVAASIVTVDGIPLVAPLGPNDTSVVTRKFNYLLDNYYWVAIEAIYEECAKLSARLTEALEEFKKK